jgi:hypothetical protein
VWDAELGRTLKEAGMTGMSISAKQAEKAAAETHFVE